jgi:hypothetical protein
MTAPSLRPPESERTLAASAAHRLVAVGASNLARMALPLLDAARAGHGAPVEAWFALGRGRSFGLRSQLLGRGLGSIRDSGLWERLPHLPPAPTTALLMDVGNDLLYGVEVPRILTWVEHVLLRLCATATERVVVGLPIAAIRSLPAWRFRLVRTLLVPGSRLTHTQALGGSEQLHDQLHALAKRHDARFHTPEPQWYGLDPVHVRRRHWREAARSWLGVEAPDAAPPCDGSAARFRCLMAAPHERTWFGHTTRTPQPVRRYLDGSSLSLW